MKVKAIESGFYGKYRNTGEDFFIKDESELGSWMEVIEEAKPVAKTPKKAKKAKSEK